MSKYVVHHICLLCSAVVFLIAPCNLIAQSASDNFPKSDVENVRSVALLTIPRAITGKTEAAVACDGSIYLAGSRWKPQDNSNLWLWRIDNSGKKLWEKSLAHQRRSEEVKIVGLLPGARKFSKGQQVKGVRVVYRQGLETELRFYNADGELVLEKHLGVLENTHGVIVDKDDKMFLFGTSMTVQNEASHAWIARVTRLGVVLWKQTYRLGDVKADITTGFLPGSFLFDAVSLADGSVVLVGQTGLYNKFGQGDSKLWLLRIDVDGNKLAEEFVDGGRIFPAGHDLIAECKEGVIVPYTTSQLPPISAAPGNFPPSGFGVRLARFNGELQKLWEKPLAKTLMPGVATITDSSPYVSISSRGDELMIQGFGEAGDRKWKVRTTTPNSSVLPLATIRLGKDIVAICNYRSHDIRQDDDLQKVLFVFARPPLP